MARFRRLHAAGEDGLHFDWRQEDDLSSGSPAWRTNLENGDHLMTHGFGWPRHPGGMAWGYYLFGPRQHHGQNPTQETGPIYHRYTDDPEGVYSESLGHGTIDRRPGGGMFATHEEAARAAEEHYFGLDRRGQAPASDLDYEKLVNPSQELDDDYGDIFGGDR